MAIDLKQLEEKPWYYGLGVGLLLGGLLYAAAYFYLLDLSEMRHRLQAKRAELDQLNQKITQGRAAERRLPQLREEVHRTEIELQRLLQILPTARNAEELIKKFQTLAQQGDFFLRRFVPKEYVNKEFYAEWPIQLQIDASYHNLALFFDKMARFSRIINVEDLQLQGMPETAGRTLSARFTAKTFIYLGDQPEAAPAAQKPKGKPAAPAEKEKGGGGID
ncbi:MAG TPA: type 4a pilus biogenesis protein PilO [Thermoanaerobaculia bacterium]|nr:type 4a pilus biogenesis protein PilO [Thermoanaerobaculia bacterium]